jgi:hypothetical protein
MTHCYLRPLALALICCLFRPAGAQTFISGIINQYSAVSAVNSATGELTVANPALFQPGDRVLLIQMQGAAISTANSAAFGDISSRNGAGNYEFGTICLVDGSTVTFEDNLTNTYAPAGRVQLIRVPQYIDAVVNGPLSAQPWNGTTGGVLAFEASSSLTLNADISVSGLGFRGGVYANGSGTCPTALSQATSYFYTQASGFGGQKGEGIAAYAAGQEYGRGAQANGGGGGNNHNSGGAGGGNASAGGIGSTRGNNFTFCNGSNPGIGGKTLSGIGYSSANPYIFMGGGGGVGHANNDEGQSGGDGGGIVILRTPLLTGNGRLISSNGEDAADAFSDGGSGGGAGGALLLEVDAFAGPLTVEARGGAGGDVTHPSNCEGPGGGGAGGVVWFSAAPGANVTRSLGGGARGLRGGCSASNNAANGSNGVEINTLALVEGGSTPVCVLPVLLLGFEAEALPRGYVRLSWTLAGAGESGRWQVERAAGGEFEPVLDGSFAQASPSEAYAALDREAPAGRLRYRLRLTDAGGQETLSDQREVWVETSHQLSFSALPQPAQAGGWHLRIFSPEAQAARLRIFDWAGRLLMEAELQLSAGYTRWEPQGLTLPAGTYGVEVSSGAKRASQRLLLY